MMRNCSILLLLSFCIMSCKKDRNCVCITALTNSNSTYTENIVYKKVTKKEIKTLCNNRQGVYPYGETTCEVK